ncbi:hypothetical protein AMTRI_Chr02g263420 [Amborella trichopoda]
MQICFALLSHQGFLLSRIISFCGVLVKICFGNQHPRDGWSCRCKVFESTPIHAVSTTKGFHLLFSLSSFSTLFGTKVMYLSLVFSVFAFYICCYYCIHKVSESLCDQSPLRYQNFGELDLKPTFENGI